jgi:cytidylate kinase
MIKVITLEREYGSGGALIARKLAERLGWKLWDQLLTDELARSMKCGHEDVQRREERRDPLYYRLFKSFMLGSFEGNPNAPRMQFLDADCLFTATRDLVKQAAEAGNGVILGRGGAYFLAERDDAYHVFVYAPAEDKVRRLQESGMSAAEAKDLVRSVDAERAAFIKKYFDLDWPTLSRYHLMINSRIGEDAVVSTILKGIAVFEKRYSLRRH